MLAGVDAALARYPWLDAGAPGHRRRQLRRPADELDRHPDRSLQGRDPHGRHLEPGQLQLHGVLPRLPGGGVRRVSARSGHDGHALGAVAAAIRGAGEDAGAHPARRERQRRARLGSRAVVHRAEGRRRRHGAGPLSARGPRPARAAAHQSTRSIARSRGTSRHFEPPKTPAPAAAEEARAYQCRSAGARGSRNRTARSNRSAQADSLCAAPRPSTYMHVAARTRRRTPQRAAPSGARRARVCRPSPVPMSR